MNDFQIDDDFNATLIDRLVDGELSEAERTELLLGFDQDPAGWRRCAVAFLEAQSWSEEFTLLAYQRPTEDHLSVAVNVAERHNHRNGAWNRFLSLAAVVLVTVGLTLLARDRFFLSHRGEPTVESLATQSDLPAAIPRHDKTDVPLPGFVANDESLTLVVDEAPNAPPRTLCVPLVEAHPFGDDLEAEALVPAIPPTVRQILERLGHRVENRRRYAPVDLDDGSKYLLPVDDVRIYPVAREMQ